MNYLVISDSHGLTDKMFDLIKKYKSYDVIHAGDYTIDSRYMDMLNIKYVRGNCDTYGKDFLTFNDFKYNFFVTHGHLFNVKMKYDNLYYKGLELKADYVIFGHTHVPYIEKIGDMYMLNPGSLRDGTYIVIEEGIPKLLKI